MFDSKSHVTAHVRSKTNGFTRWANILVKLMLDRVGSDLEMIFCSFSFDRSIAIC